MKTVYSYDSAKTLRYLFNVFSIAIKEERKAQSMYSKAAAKTKNKTIKTILNMFVKEELGHEKKLEKMYADIKLLVKGGE